MSGVFKVKGRIKIGSIFLSLLSSGLSLFIAIVILLPFDSRKDSKPDFLPVNTPLVHSQKKLVSGFKMAGFDTLQKAQKDIQHDLGLPEHSPLQDDGSQEQHPPGHYYIAWLLLLISVAGFLAFVLIVIRENRRTKTIPNKEDSTERGIENHGVPIPTALVPTLPPPIRLIPAQEPDRRDLSGPPQDRSEEALLIANHLDSLLRSVRTNLAEIKDCFKVSLYHFEEDSGFFHQIADSTGKGFQVFFTPRFLTSEQADNWKKGFSTTWCSEKTDNNEEIFSIAFPFFDSMGTLFALSVSKNGKRTIPIDWYGPFSDLIPILQKKLLEYSKLQYAPLINTKNPEGELDFRAMGSRIIEEIQKGKDLGNHFMLLFLKLTETGNRDTGKGMGPQEFFERFKEKVRGTLRSSDSLTDLDTNLLMVLLPETERMESEYVLNRILDLFNGIPQDGTDPEMRLFSNLLEWSPASREDPQHLIERGIQFNIPRESNTVTSRPGNLFRQDTRAGRSE